MIKINLLPRGLREEGKGLNRGTVWLIVGCVGVILILFGLLQYEKYKLGKVKREITTAQKETRKLAPQIRVVENLEKLKAKVEQRMGAIEKLDKNRAFWINLLERLSVAVPENLWLTSFKEFDGSDAPRVIIEGESYSLNNLASFMLRLGHVPVFDGVELDWVKQAQEEKRKTFSFQVSCNLKGGKPVVPRPPAGKKGKG